MKEKWNYILYLMWFSYLILSAVIMFGKGFLLSRKTLSDISECVPLDKFNCDGRVVENVTKRWFCSDEQKIPLILSNPGAPMICAPERHRVLFLLVDALRYDFTEYNPQLEKPLHFQNKLPVMQETLEKWPERTRLYRFMADPPTTTLQRVKALVTGSLPTFIDFSSNFAAMELQEDNIIDQTVKGNSKTVLLGDDTWLRLMPGKWLRTHAQYSFHTWDLDTVDNEIDSKIYDELKNDDWDLLVAHYLGVDHAGHRYGPNHSEMARKLKETNVRLQMILENIPPDVLLYVVGDHGMTESDSHEWTESGGDHGGESKAERTAAFFAYRGSGFGSLTSDITSGEEVQQTDLAPSMAAAMGRPPPSPSLGNVLMPVLPQMTVTQMLVHLSNNLKQITHYLVRYGEESQQVALDKLAELINATRDQIEKARTVNNHDDLNNYIVEVRSVVDNVRFVFREVWVEFDSLSMLRALLLLLLAIFFNWLVTEGLPFDRIPLIFASSFVSSGNICRLICVALCLMGNYYGLFENLEHAIFLSTGLVSGGLSALLVIMHWDGITQRWYEGRSPFYERFARAAFVASAAVLVSNSYIIEEGAVLAFLTLSVQLVMVWSTGSARAVLYWLACGSVIAISRLYRGCREEQGDCWTSGGGLASTQASRVALVLALGSMSAVVATTRRLLGWRGHGLVLAGLLACGHWAVGWGSLGSPSKSRLLARLAWVSLGTLFALVWRREGGVILPLSLCGLVMYVANTLSVGASFAPAATLALLAAFLAINIVTTMKAEGSNKISITSRCSTSVACMWALLASYQFYGMGHHATLGHLRWGAAFHAGDPNYLNEYMPPATVAVTTLFVGFDLFGMAFSFGACCPLLALWGLGAGAGPRAQAAAIFSLCLKFALCFAVRIFACAISATIHCRHLMIWGVFAPKLLFEGAQCAAAMLGAILGATLAFWHMPSQQRTS